MTTNFPNSVDSYSTKVDNVDQVLAAHINDLQDAMVAVQTVVINQPGAPNLLYHTLTHDLWPQGVTFNDIADDSYVAGLWNVVHNGQAPDVSGATGTITGAARHILCTFDSANSQAGFLQFLTNKDSVALRGKTVSFSIEVVGSGVSNLRAAILAWTGTADALTSDVVSAWQTGNPVLATNWAYVGDTPVDQPLSGQTTIVVEGVEVGTTHNNIAVFVWTPDLEGNTDTIRLAKAKLEEGSVATPFVGRSVVDEVIQVQQFVIRSGDGEANGILMPSGYTTSTTDGSTHFQFPTEMYKVPTLITSGTAADYEVQDSGGVVVACNAVPTLGSSTTKKLTRVNFTVASGLTANRPAILRSDVAGDGFLIFDARL